MNEHQPQQQQQRYLPQRQQHSEPILDETTETRETKVFGLIAKRIIYGCESRGDADSPYLTRYAFPRIGGRMAVHVFHRSDFDVHHDHPFGFVSIILWRGYVEETPEGRARKYPGMILFRRATHRHRVELIDGKRAITFVVFGPRWREWGFFTSDGWVQWQEYFRDKGC